jgi:AcrR family transcriptional regulator
VAAHAGVGIGTVYRRFPNKEALVDALFEKSIGKFVELATRARQVDDSWEGLVLFLELATQMQAEDFGLRDVMLHDVYGQDRVAQAKARITPLVTEIVERAQRDGHLRDDFVTADVPIIELMLASVAAYTSDLAPDLWRRYLGIVLDGICAERTSYRDLPDGPSLEVVHLALHGDHRRR